jgi:Protein of unknown function (DUF3347)
MKKVFLLLLLAISAFAAYWFLVRKKESAPEGPAPVPMALKKHSEKFNTSVDSIVTSYLAIKNAFIESDMAGAKAATTSFSSLLKEFPIDELKKDTAAILATVQMNIESMQANATSLLSMTDITEMRRDFNSLTEAMYPSFFTSINYEGQKLFVEKCPMAFGNDVPASWISNSKQILNPYLGKDHPKYKAQMLDCGEVVDSIMAK